MLKSFLKALSKAESVLMSSLFAFNLAILFITVVMRYAFNNSPTWTEEASRYVMIWIIYLGVSLSIEQQSEIKIDILKKFFTAKTLHIYLSFFRLIIGTAITVFIIIYGIKFAAMLYETQQYAAAFDMPMFFIYTIIPLSGLLMTIKYVNEMAKLIRSMKR